MEEKPIRKILLIEDEANITSAHKIILSQMFNSLYTLEFIWVTNIADLEKLLEGSSISTYHLCLIDGEIEGGHTKPLLSKLPQERSLVASNSRPYVEYARSIGYHAGFKYILDENMKHIIESIINKS